MKNNVHMLLGLLGVLIGFSAFAFPPHGAGYGYYPQAAAPAALLIRGNQPFRARLNGQWLVASPQHEIRTAGLTPGTHQLEIAFPGRPRPIFQQVQLLGGHESAFQLQATRGGRHGHGGWQLQPIGFQPWSGFAGGAFPGGYPGGFPGGAYNYSPPISTGGFAGGAPVVPLIGDAELARLQAAIRAQGFEENRLSIARQGIRSYTLLAADVRDLLELFRFEDTRLAFAKIAYARTTDPENYFVVNDAFRFSSSVLELDRFVNQQAVFF